VPETTDTRTGFYEDDEPVEDVRRAFDEGAKAVTLPPPGVPAAYHVCHPDGCGHRPAGLAVDDVDSDLALALIHARADVIEAARDYARRLEALGGPCSASGTALVAAMSRLTELERTDR